MLSSFVGWLTFATQVIDTLAAIIERCCAPNSEVCQVCAHKRDSTRANLWPRWLRGRARSGGECLPCAWIVCNCRLNREVVAVPLACGYPIRQYMMENPLMYHGEGCLVLLVYSCVLTRTVAAVKSDMEQSFELSLVWL